MQEPAHRANSLAHGRDFAAQPSIKAEVTAAAVDDKQENQHREEQVRPRPLGRTAVEAEPVFASALAPSISRATIQVRNWPCVHNEDTRRRLHL